MNRFFPLDTFPHAIIQQQQQHKQRHYIQINYCLSPAVTAYIP